MKIGDTVTCKTGSLPYGRGGKRKIISIAKNHSIYVELTKKDSAYQDREPNQDYWQIMWEDFTNPKSKL
mgnify:FL=1